MRQREKAATTSFHDHTTKKSHEAVTSVVPHNVQSALKIIFIVGIIGLLCTPLSHAQEYPADSTRGKSVYQQHCQACHGTGGQGEGPDAKTLRVAPANFHRFSSFMKSDEELLRTIEHGVVFSPMHAWRGQLSDGEMQDVVVYIRQLSQPAH